MKILGIASNFYNLNEEKKPKPKWQNVFIKANSSLSSSSNFIYPSFSKEVWYEAELVIRINKKLKNVSPSEALEAWDEFTLGIDWTAKDVQNYYKSKGWPWALAKGFDQASLIGSWMKRKDFKNSKTLNLEFRVNDEIKQAGNTKDLKIKIEEIISFCSKCMTLDAGDLIFTGAPPTPGPIAVGDCCKGYINGIEVLNFKVSEKI